MKRIVGVIWLLLLMAVPAFATVSVETTRVAYTCNGVLTSYAYPFKVLADADLLVVKKATATSAETTLTLNTDYTVTGAGTSGGNVVLTAGSKCGSGYTLTILRDMAATQTTDYVDGEAFSAVSIEDALDKVTMIQQQQREQIGRAPKLPETSTITDISFPNPTANNYIGWNAGATGLENKSSPVITTATQYEVDALVSYGSGTSFTQATIEAALDAIGTTNKVTLLLRPGNWVISTALTFPANVTVKMPTGAYFSGTGMSLVTFASSQQVSPIWWGFSETASEELNSSALQAALSSGAAKIEIPSGTFSYSTGLVISNAVKFNGSGAKTGYSGTVLSGTILSYTGAGIGITISGSDVEDGAYNIHLADFMLTGTNSATGGILVGGLSTQPILFSSLENITVNGFTKLNAYGISFVRTQQLLFKNVYCFNNYDGFYFNNVGAGNTSFTGISCSSSLNTHYGWRIEGLRGSSFYNCVAETNGYGGLYIYGSGAYALNFFSIYNENNNTSGISTAKNTITGSAADGPANNINFWGGMIQEIIPAIKLDYARKVTFNNTYFPDMSNGFMVVTANTLASRFNTSNTNLTPTSVTGNTGNVRIDDGNIPFYLAPSSIPYFAGSKIPYTSGIVLINDTTNNTSAIFSLNGAAHTATLLSANSTGYTGTIGHAATINLGWSVGDNSYIVDNRTGGAITVLINMLIQR